LGERAHLLSKIDRITLATHIEDVTNLLFFEDLSEVVLVGHSYAGMVITGVAARESRRLAHLVYFDAYIPSEGESEIDLWPPDVQAKARADIAKGLNIRPLPPDFPGFLGVTDPRLAAWMQERFTPHPFSTYEDPPPSSSPESASIPRTYIHCTLGHVASWMADMGTFAAKARGLRWKVYELAAGHDAMLTHPKEVADILLGIASK
jgi:pimeloyl-ACP methyl ester carboxylesterase